MKSYKRCIAIAFTAALGSACAGPVAKPRAESEAMARSRLMLARLDQLEADLHSEATAIDTFAVLQDRHGEASQMACKVTDEHVNEMHRLLVAQLEKRKQKVAQHNKKLAALGRAHASSGRGRASAGRGKAGRASASGRATASASAGRASASSSARAPGATPASSTSRKAPAAQGRAPSAPSRASSSGGKTSGALSMR